MRIISFFAAILILFSSFELKAQSFSFERTSPQWVYGNSGHGSPDTDIVSHGIIRNLTNSTINIKFYREYITIPVGWSTAMCSSFYCYFGDSSEVEHIGPNGYDSMFAEFFYADSLNGTGQFTIRVKDMATNDSITQVFGVQINPIGIRQIGAIVKDFELGQNYPNPFNPTTKIDFNLPKSEYVYLRVYDILGREVKTLVSGVLAAGEYNVDFDARNLASGMYYYSLRAGDFVSVKKMVLVK